jgi:hypothetical protein
MRKDISPEEIHQMINKVMICTKKLAALRSKSAAKYHLQTAITPFAKLTYFYQELSAISI